MSFLVPKTVLCDSSLLLSMFLGIPLEISKQPKCFQRTTAAEARTSSVWFGDTYQIKTLSISSSLIKLVYCKILCKKKWLHPHNHDSWNSLTNTSLFKNECVQSKNIERTFENNLMANNLFSENRKKCPFNSIHEMLDKILFCFITIQQSSGTVTTTTTTSKKKTYRTRQCP